MAERIDFNHSAILRGEMALAEAGDKLLDMLIRTCDGRWTTKLSMTA